MQKIKILEELTQDSNNVVLSEQYIVEPKLDTKRGEFIDSQTRDTILEISDTGRLKGRSFTLNENYNYYIGENDEGELILVVVEKYI